MTTPDTEPRLRRQQPASCANCGGRLPRYPWRCPGCLEIFCSGCARYHWCKQKDEHHRHSGENK